MCWTSKEQIVLRKAEEPIPVFKILRQNMLSVYMHFVYNLHTKYFQAIGTPHITRFGCHIFEGIHSYDAKTTFIKDHPRDSHFFVIVTKKDKKLSYLDTFSKFIFRSESAYIQAMGVIPEGAEYYRNEWGEIVSNSIILTEIKHLIN